MSKYFMASRLGSSLISLHLFALCIYSQLCWVFFNQSPFKTHLKRTNVRAFFFCSIKNPSQSVRGIQPTPIPFSSSNHPRPKSQQLTSFALTQPKSQAQNSAQPVFPISFLPDPPFSPLQREYSQQTSKCKWNTQRISSKHDNKTSSLNVSLCVQLLDLLSSSLNVSLTRMIFNSNGGTRFHPGSTR